MEDVLFAFLHPPLGRFAQVAQHDNHFNVILPQH